jgi:amino acid permease
MHVAYEIGHAGFWPVIVLLAIAAAILVACMRATNPRPETLSQ